MRPRYWISMLSLIALAVVIAGCSGTNQSTPTPTPTPVPTVSAQPTVESMFSPQVELTDFKILQGAGRTGNYTFTLVNHGSAEARNVIISLYARDIRNLEVQQDTLYQLYEPIPAHGNATVTIPTGMYSLETTSVILNIRVTWGDHAEYYTDKNLTHILPWAPQPVNI